jgi:hypothetical protein
MDARRGAVDDETRITPGRPWSVSDLRNAGGELHVAGYWIDEQARLTDEDLAEWQRRWEQANTPAARRRHMKREMRRLLTRRTRLRLWWHGRIDAVAIWLAGMGRAGRALARALWRVTGLWL